MSGFGWGLVVVMVGNDGVGGTMGMVDRLRLMTRDGLERCGSSP